MKYPQPVDLWLNILSELTYGKLSLLGAEWEVDRVLHNLWARLSLWSGGGRAGVDATPRQRLRQQFPKGLERGTAFCTISGSGSPTGAEGGGQA